MQMATSLTRFEVQLPLFADGTSQANAVNTFLSNVLTLCPYIQNDGYIHQQDGVTVTQVRLVYGLITTLQQAAALAFLVTLNTSLGQNVLCTINTVSSEP